MVWQIEWKKIDSRISGFLSSVEIFFNGLTGHGDHYGVSNNYVLPNADSIVKDLRLFSASYAENIPEGAKKSIDDFNTKFSSHNGRYNGLPGMHAVSTMLAGFRSEFNFCISGLDVQIKGTVERSLIHLQRSIVVEEAVQKKWIEAFEKGEPACERLGSIHLLGSGIWAFKAHGEGARTDLILGSPIDTKEVVRSESALVLTEWKLAKSKEKISDKITQATKQCNLYSNGILAGFELSSYRYIIIVSEEQEEMPSDNVQGIITYRHVNIAVKPSSPSIASR